MNTQTFNTADAQLAKEHRDPITNEPGSHPVGTGVGSMVVGASTGAAVGMLGAGPVGMAVGAVAGAIVGGLAGHEVAEQINPTVEDAYWKAHFRERPYFANKKDVAYETYEPAYRFGWESYEQFGRDEHGKGVAFSDVEPNLRTYWEEHYADKRLRWEEANEPVRDAWDRVEAELRKNPLNSQAE